jgi:hypothetical protein
MRKAITVPSFADGRESELPLFSLDGLLPIDQALSVNAAETDDRTPNAPPAPPAGVAALLSARGPLREPLLFVPGTIRRALFTSERRRRRVAFRCAGGTIATGVCPGTGHVEKGIEATLQCALRAAYQITPVRLRHLHLHLVFSLCAHLASYVGAGSARTRASPPRRQTIASSKASLSGVIS